MSDFEQKLLQGFVDRPPMTPEEVAELVCIAESVANWHQVSKALCGKENATLEEALQVINQVMPRTFAIPPRSGKTLAVQRIAVLEQELAAVKQERDVAVSVVKDCCGCEKCDHYTGTEEYVEAICLDCEDKCHFEMRSMKGLPVTPAQFLAKVERLYDNGRDPEVFHDKTDALMEDILISFGYQKGIEFLRSKVRWSA